MKKRILFVDDKAHLLKSLKKVLREMRHEWQGSFASSGEEALSHMAGAQFDVIVADMNMQSMSGIELLNDVRVRYPHMVRIIVSDHSEMESNIQSVTVAHQCLSKPCDPVELKKTIKNTSLLGEILQDKGLVEMVSGMKSIPSLPSLYTEVVKELKDSNSSIKDVGRIISKDMGMSAKILQVINSSFFGLPQHISDPEKAALYLGLDSLKGLVLASGVFSLFNQRRWKSLVDRLWNHSAFVGACALRLAEEEKCEPEVIEDALLAGLLHDVGRLLMASYMPEKYGEVILKAKGGGTTLWEAEKEMLGTTHGEVGAYLLCLWGLSDNIVEALAYHHCPERSKDKEFGALAAVHVADFLEQESSEEHRKPIGIVQLNEDYLSGLGKGDRLPAWRSICEESSKQ